ncbi:hypothetical protein D5R81_01135 [Parashewanella spongiae]|uniref:Ankyrin repeat domain-containing protein n=1 Tax=Parashewanella spongiae TaxID=342950 RepID=A0A3A6U1P2_9GAMM|nr:ankyrin repeat domain-containing protein [Parashewanella spongiae]MCL1077185.1 ankyrin repeat domain-containing protein [Parashewanella spongiae]RJY19340.1 hypothetical protein D5R81_01135 [Parashewanella spongiae]
MAVISITPPTVSKEQKISTDYESDEANVKPQDVENEIKVGSESYMATAKTNTTKSLPSSVTDFHSTGHNNPPDGAVTKHASKTTHYKITSTPALETNKFTTPKEALDSYTNQLNHARRVALDHSMKVSVSDLHCLINLNYDVTQIESVIIRMMDTCKASIDELFSGKTALILACEKGNLGLVKVLLANHADVTATNVNHQKAKHVAAKHNQLEILKVILKDSRSVCEVTDIHVLLKMNCDLNFIQFMIGIVKGNEESSPDFDEIIDGKTALQLAREKKVQGAISALLYHGAKDTTLDADNQVPNFTHSKRRSLKKSFKVSLLRPSSSKSTSSRSSRRYSSSSSDDSLPTTHLSAGQINDTELERFKTFHSQPLSIRQSYLHTLIKTAAAPDYIYKVLTELPDEATKGEIEGYELETKIDGISALELAWSSQNHGIILALVAVGADTSLSFSCEKNLKQLLFETNQHDLLKIILNQPNARIECEDLKYVIELGWEQEFFNISVARANKCDNSFLAKVNLPICGKPLLEYAYERNNDNFIYELITVGVDLETPFSNGLNLRQILLEKKQIKRLLALFNYRDTRLTSHDLRTIIDFNWGIECFKHALMNIKKVVSSYRTAINQKFDGKTLLELAWERRQNGIVYELISAGADLQQPFSEGKNLKQILLETQNHKALKQLLTYQDTPIECSDLHTFVLFSYGLDNLNQAIIKAKALKPTLNLETKIDGKTLLELAWEKKDLELIVALIAHGADIMTPFSQGNTLIQSLIKNSSFESFMIHLQQHRPITIGVIITLRKLKCELSCIEAHLQLASIRFLDEAFNINETINGQTALELAWKEQDHEFIITLVQAGANSYLPFSTSKNLKQTLKHARQFDLLKTLLSIPSCPVEPEDMHTAIEQMWDQSVLISILERGKLIPKVYGHKFHFKFIDEPNASNQSAIELACKRGSIKAVTTLLEYGANNDPYCRNGFSLMHIAAFQSHLELLQLLINYEKPEVVALNGSSLYKLDNSGEHTPLHLGLFNGNNSMRAYLFAIALEKILTLENGEGITPYNLLCLKVDQNQIISLLSNSVVSRHQKFVDVQHSLEQAEFNLQMQSSTLAILEIPSKTCKNEAHELKTINASSISKAVSIPASIDEVEIDVAPSTGLLTPEFKVTNKAIPSLKKAGMPVTRISEAQKSRFTELPKPDKRSYKEVEVAYDKFFSNPQYLVEAHQAKITMLQDLEQAKLQIAQHKKTRAELNLAINHSKSRNQQLIEKLAELEAKNLALETQQTELTMNFSTKESKLRAELATAKDKYKKAYLRAKALLDDNEGIRGHLYRLEKAFKTAQETGEFKHPVPYDKLQT